MLLICQHCKRPSAAEARFCSDCGTELHRQECAACHAINPSDAEQCHACGVTLRAAALAAAFAPLPQFPLPNQVSAPVVQPQAALVELPPPPAAAAHPPVQWALEPAPAGTGTGVRGSFAPYAVGLGTVGALAALAVMFVNWSHSSTAPPPIKPMERPVAAGMSMERPATSDKTVDAAADAAAAAAARLLAAGSDTPAGSSPPARPPVGTGATPAPVRTSPERNLAPAPATAIAPTLAPPRAAAAPPAAATQVAQTGQIGQTAPMAAGTPPPTAAAPLPPATVRPAPLPTPAPPPVPNTAARDPQTRTAPPVLPRECTPAMEALAICTPVSKP